MGTIGDGLRCNGETEVETMHLAGMRLAGVPPFTEPVEFEFDERVNVVVGPNAVGKSTMLSEINLAFHRELRGETIRWRATQGMRPPAIWHYENLEQDSDYLADGRINFVSIKSGSAIDHFTEPQDEPLVVHFGPIRMGLSTGAIGERTDLDGTPARELLARGFSGENLRRVFDQSRVETELMFGQERERREAGDADFERRAYNFFRVDELAYQCARSICGDVLIGDRPRNYVTGLNLEDLENQPLANFEQVSIRRSLGVSTIDVPNFDNVNPEHRPAHSGKSGPEPLDASFLSSGTQTPYLWIWWLALSMLHHHEFAADWEQRPAVLLIDEIENHLHPTWQRRVIPALLKHFPGLQIFATTHSPFVVAGLQAGQVHLLRRDMNGVVRATTNKEAIEGWTADEILRVYMGVEHPTDEVTAVAARELRKLRDEGERAGERAEEERQAEIGRLRKLVDRAELSGPRVAENERFLANLDAILKRHVQPRSLDQENG